MRTSAEINKEYRKACENIGHARVQIQKLRAWEEKEKQLLEHCEKLEAELLETNIKEQVENGANKSKES